MRSGGQIYSGEFLVGFVIFMSALTVILTLWNTVYSDIFDMEGRHTMESFGSDAVEKLVRTRGVPVDWGVDNVTSLGLINESRILMPEKIYALSHLMDDTQSDLCTGMSNYECNAYLMGLGRYHFFMTFSYLNGSQVVVSAKDATAGRQPVNETEVMTIMRTSILEGEIVRLYVTVWRQ